MTRAPEHLRRWAWYLPHQATLAVPRHDPEGVAPKRAELIGADFSSADLTGADLRDADLTEADLTEADFTEADFTGADLHCALLAAACLTGAQLSGANLTGADLIDADFSSADLTGTVLDPLASVLPCTDEELLGAGLEPRCVQGRNRVYGYRTRRSLHVGDHEYLPRRWHRAHALSIDQATACHPGIYFGGSDIAGRDDLVRCWAYRDEYVHVSRSKGGRARRIWVLAPEEGGR